MVQSWSITASGKANENSFPHICGTDALGDMGGGAVPPTFAKMVRAIYGSATGDGFSHGDAKCEAA